MALLSMREGASVKTNVFKEFVINLLASTQVLRKKKQTICLFLNVFDALFVDVRHILINYSSQALLLEN